MGIGLGGWPSGSTVGLLGRYAMREIADGAAIGPSCTTAQIALIGVTAGGVVATTSYVSYEAGIREGENRCDDRHPDVNG